MLRGSPAHDAHVLGELGHPARRHESRLAWSLSCSAAGSPEAQQSWRMGVGEGFQSDRSWRASDSEMSGGLLMPYICCLLFALAGSGALEFRPKICRVCCLAQGLDALGHACRGCMHRYMAFYALSELRRGPGKLRAQEFPSWQWPREGHLPCIMLLLVRDGCPLQSAGSDTSQGPKCTGDQMVLQVLLGPACVPGG